MLKQTKCNIDSCFSLANKISPSGGIALYIIFLIHLAFVAVLYEASHCASAAAIFQLPRSWPDGRDRSVTQDITLKCLYCYFYKI